MLKGSRFFTYVGVLALCVLAVAGCKKRSRSRSSSSSSNEIFTTDSFPGQDVQSGNVADDQRAMSVSGEDLVPGSVRSFSNGDTGVVIVTYLTQTGRLYAHYYDGSQWSKPVALGALDCILTTAQANTAVAFINTDDTSTDSANDRNGDAIVFWLANDGDNDGAGVDITNTNLWSTYFDVTHAFEIAANQGFQVNASRVSNLEDSGDEAGAGNEAVSTFGLISDGLCGQATWFSGGNSYEWGDATHDSIVVFWRQNQDNDGTAASGFNSDQYIGTARFDLNAGVDPEIPLAPSANSRLATQGFGASDSGISSEETQVDSTFITYNNNLFYRTVSTNTPAIGGAGTPGTYIAPVFTAYGNAISANNQDGNLQNVAFNLATGAPSVATTLNATSPVSTTGDLNESNAQFVNLFVAPTLYVARSVYGSDEGLATLSIYSVQLTSDTDDIMDFGELAADGRLRLTEINEATGTFFGGINVDTDQTLVFDSVTEFNVDIQMSRNGDYIWAAWLENTDNSPAGAEGNDALGLWASRYRTTRIDDDGTFPLPPALGTTVSGAANVNTGIATFPVSFFQFQSQLGYVCGIQSDPDVMNLLFQHSDATTDVYFVTRLGSGIITGTATFSTTALESSLNGDFSGTVLPVNAFDNSLFSVFGTPGFGKNVLHIDRDLVDSGEGGNVYVNYRRNINSVVADNRLFAEKTGLGGGTAEIDSNTTNKQVASFGVNFLFRTVATAAGEEIGEYDPIDAVDSDARPNAATFIHTIFYESRFNESDGLGFAMKARMFSTQDTAVAFGDNFTPNAGATFTVPFALDLPFVAPAVPVANLLNGPYALNTFVSDNTVGLVFVEGFHLYYHEANPDQDNGDDDEEVVWLNAEGISDPFLIDDDNDEELQSIEAFGINACSCDTLSNAKVFWTKAYGSGGPGSTSQRLQVRVRDGGNDD